MSGCLHLYSGLAKGKTTAAMGLALRAFGRGWPVAVVHFLKGRLEGADRAFATLGLPVHLIEHPLPPWHREKDDLAADSAKLLALAAAFMDEHHAQGGLLVLDEALGALEKEVLSPAQLKELIHRRGAVELVLTGRVAPVWLRDLADYHTEMTLQAHPFVSRGLAAREGVEF